MAEATESTGKKWALCVGINDYPYDGNDLNGCVNDANAWAETLINTFGFPRSDVRVMTDSEATKANILKALDDLLAGAAPGDVLAFTNSSHGSYVPDTSTSGDEIRDEVLCPYDISDNHISDDELRERFTNLKDGVRLTVILDNCFSGTGTRAPVEELIPGYESPDDRRVRFLHPALRGKPFLQDPWSAKSKREGLYPESGMKEVLLTGCSDTQYSYDAYIDGKYHGAMTYYALAAIRQAGGKLTYSQLHQRIKQTIRTFPQTPQLEGKAENKKRQIFT